MTISAKFAGTCTKCHSRIAVGDKVEWSRGVQGAYHTVCPVVIVATPAVIQTEAPKVNQSLIVQFLKAANAHIKFPKVRFLAPDGKSELRLNLAGAGSKYPGAVQVKVGGNWVGRINADGAVTHGIDAMLFATLGKIASNPAGAAAAYGALSGHCSFCNLKLTDEGSVEVGYGPICAVHYGLPHKALGTKAVKVVESVTPAPGFVPAPAPVTLAPMTLAPTLAPVVPVVVKPNPDRFKISQDHFDINEFNPVVRRAAAKEATVAHV